MADEFARKAALWKNVTEGALTVDGSAWKQFADQWSKAWEDASARAAASLAAARDVAKGFLVDWISAVREGGDLFKSFADSVVNSLNRIIDKLLDKTLDGFLGNILGSSGGLLGSLLGGGTSGFQSVIDSNRAWAGPTPNAFGGVYGAAQRFAKGGSFTNSIVNTPTLFRFANGAKMGEMGEAGPEAIMPLKRGPNGALGVQASGGGKRSVEVTVVNNNSFAGAIGIDSIAAMQRETAETTYNQVKRDLQSLLTQMDQDGSFAT